MPTVVKKSSFSSRFGTSADYTCALSLVAELEHLLHLLNAQPDVFHGLTIGKIFRFVACAARLKDDIMLTQPLELSALQAPENLLPSIRHFLAQICDIPDSYTDICWSALKDSIWSEGEQLQGSLEPHFHNYGHSMGISVYISMQPLAR